MIATLKDDLSVPRYSSIRATSARSETVRGGTRSEARVDWF